MIVIVDYKAGNLASVKKALNYLGAKTEVSDDPRVIARAAKLILPGVGHFAATRALEGQGLRSLIVEAVTQGTPFLGICLGMQWMFTGSDEAPEVPGLGLFDGMCERFPLTVISPHVGWNTLEVGGSSRLLQGVNRGAFAYFTHSYRAPLVKGTVAQTEYGGFFTSVVERGNISGVQFHPEKSGELGLQIFRNFLSL